MGMCVGWRMVGQKRCWSILQPGFISMLSAVQKAQPDLGPWMPSCESHVLSPPILTLTGDVTWFKPIYANFACMEESGCEKWLLELTIDLETSHTTDNWPAHFLSKVSATVAMECFGSLYSGAGWVIASDRNNDGWSTCIFLSWLYQVMWPSSNQYTKTLHAWKTQNVKSASPIHHRPESPYC